MTNIDQLTIKDAREIAALFGATMSRIPDMNHPYAKGEQYFIRTVTHHYTGRLIEVYEHELVLEQAAWIADDGRFAQAVALGEFNEVEPFPEGSQVIIGRGSIIDASIFKPKLPVIQK